MLTPYQASSRAAPRRRPYPQRCPSLLGPRPIPARLPGVRHRQPRKKAAAVHHPQRAHCQHRKRQAPPQPRKVGCRAWGSAASGEPVWQRVQRTAVNTQNGAGIITWQRQGAKPKHVPAECTRQQSSVRQHMSLWHPSTKPSRTLPSAGIDCFSNPASTVGRRAQRVLLPQQDGCREDPSVCAAVSRVPLPRLAAATAAACGRSMPEARQHSSAPAV